MKTVIYKQRGFVIRGKFPLLHAIIMLQKTREPDLRKLIRKVNKDGEKRIARLFGKE